MPRAGLGSFNLRDRIPALRKASELIAGFSGRRSLPQWRADSYRDRSDWAYKAAPEGEPLREVVLFADTFNRYFERENLDAALRVLVAGGYRVHAALPADGEERPLCCGRTFLSVGAVDEARARDAAHACCARALCGARRAGDRTWSRVACSASATRCRR